MDFEAHRISGRMIALPEDPDSLINYKDWWIQDGAQKRRVVFLINWGLNPLYKSRAMQMKEEWEAISYTTMEQASTNMGSRRD
ncbi:hypothetical protein AAC387_Pa02g2144 [Persea americana]